MPRHRSHLLYDLIQVCPEGFLLHLLSIFPSFLPSHDIATLSPSLPLPLPFFPRVPPPRPHALLDEQPPPPAPTPPLAHPPAAAPPLSLRSLQICTDEFSSR